MQQNPHSTYRRTIAAAILAVLALPLLASEGHGKPLPDPGSASVREQSAPEDKTDWEPSWAAEREQSPFLPSPPMVSAAVREQTPTLPVAPPLTAAAGERMKSRSSASASGLDVNHEVETPDATANTEKSLGWTEGLALGAGFLAGLVIAGGLVLILRHRPAV